MTYRAEVEDVLVEDSEMPDCYGIGYLRDQQLMLIELGVRLGLEAAKAKMQRTGNQIWADAIDAIDPASVLKGEG